MLRFSANSPISAPLGRRDFLRIGALGLGGLTLADQLALQSALAEAGSIARDKSVIFLFMHGGPSQFETFDPKMDAPSEIRSVTGEIPTSIPGITFGATFPKLARLADKFSIVRSFVTGDSVHDLKNIAGKHTLNANLGSLYSRIAGSMNQETAMPSNITLLPRAVAPEAGPQILQFGDITAGGELGAGFRPFVPGSGEGAQADMTLALPLNRLEDRRSLLSTLDRWKREMDYGATLSGLSGLQQKAFGLLRSGVSDAFDLSKEAPGLVARYDTSPLLPRNRISTQWKNIEHYADNALSLGRLLLLARRLCERGAGFVTVTTSFVWDMHADVNNAPMQTGMDYVGRPFDHAVSALIEDIESRGLREKILLVCCGEMGRTPRISAKGGRDHWGGLAPLMLYGGGLHMGRVIGRSNKEGAEPADNPVTIPDLVATILHTLIDVSQARLIDGLPANLLSLLNRGTPIQGLV
jgi:uncharacterized protein (DUF1501 family)